MTEPTQNPQGNWFDGLADGHATQAPVTPEAAPQAAQAAPQAAPSWSDGLTEVAPAAAETTAPTQKQDTRSTWEKIKSTVAGPNTALNTPLGERKSEEISGVNDLIHGEFAKGGHKIWDSEKIDAKNVIPGSPVEWAIRQFNPDFHGLATKESQAADKLKNPNPGEKPFIDIAQFVDKEKHPIAKALTEVGQGLTSPENVAIMYGTGGLGLIGKTPQALKAFGVVQKLVSAGFGYQALQGAYEHSKAFMEAMNNGDANEAEYQLTHALASGTMAIQAGSHAAEGVAVPGTKYVPVEHAIPFMTDTDKAVAGKIAETVGKATSGAVDFSKQKLTDAADTMGRTIGRTDDFSTALTSVANKLGKKTGPEFRDKVERVSDDLKQIVNNDTDNKIVDPKTAAAAIQEHLNQLEAPLQQQSGEERGSIKPVVPNFREQAEARINKFFDENPGKYGNDEAEADIKQKLLDRVSRDHDLGNGVKTSRDPNLFEAENIRQGLKQYDPTENNGFRAAAGDLANFMREKIDEGYDQRGITNVKETRGKEADLIDVRDALEDAQSAFEKQKNMPALLKLFSVGKLVGLVGTIGAHFLGGNVLGGAVAAGTAWKAAHEHFTQNIESNLSRAQDLAAREPGATATETGTTPPVQGPNNSPQAPPQPGMPTPPTPPTPATPPAVNHTLNGTLSTYFGNFVNEEPYADLLQRFSSQVADMKKDVAAGKEDPNYKPKYTQDQIVKAEKVQAQVNAEHAKEHAQMEKEDKVNAAKYVKEKAKYDNDVRVKAEKERADNIAKQEADKAAAAAAEEKRKQDLISNPLVAHSVLNATDRALPITGVDDRTSDAAHEHELGHVMAHTAEGLTPVRYVTDQHPDAQETGAAAQVHTNIDDAEEGPKGLAQRVVGILGGPAFDEVHNGLTIGRNGGARGDIAKARQILREEGGLSGNQLDKVFDALYDRAKEHVSNPEAFAIAKINARLREEGLHPNFHMSEGRMENLVKLLKGVYNGKTPSTEGVHEGDSDGAVSEGKPADTGGSGEEQDGAAGSARAEAAPKTGEEPSAKRKEFEELNEGSNVTTTNASHEKSELKKASVPPERSTGNADDDAAIKKGGGVPGGMLGRPEDTYHVKMFHDPESGTTLGLSAKEAVTPEAVAAKIKESRRQYKNGDLPKEDFQGVHFSGVPAEEGVVRGNTRGAAKAGSEQARVALGAEPGVYAYREGSRFEPQIASRQNKYSISGQKAIADISGEQGGIFNKAAEEARAAAKAAGDNDTTAAHKAINAGETAIKDAGYDGYENKEYPGSTFLFGDQKVEAHPGEQIAAHEANGGSTFKDGKNLAGTDGYSVAPYPERSQVVDELTPKILNDYKTANQDLLGDGEHAVGTWKDPESGKTYLDVTKTIADKDAAIKAGQDANQKAIYNLKTGETLDTGGTGEAPKIEKSDLTKGSSVPLMENPLKVKGTGENDKISTLDVAKALNKYSQKQHPALELGEAEPADMVARAKKIAEDEAKYQLAGGKTGTEWYTTEMKDHDEALKSARPEFEGGEPIDSNAAWPHNPKLSLFKAAEAILSSGQKPYGNFKSAVKAWDIYNETGEFPRTQPDGKSWGPRGVAAYGNAMGMLNQLVSTKGEKGAAEWLLSDHPVSELKEYNTGVKGKKTDMAPGAMILGQKRGPFMQNLHGIESAFTADMWVSRTWNRWMGTMEFGKDKDGVDEIKTDSPRNGQERDLMKKSFSETADKLNLSTSSLQAVLWYYEQALYGKQGIPKESWSFKDAAQRAVKEMPNEQEAESFPHGANEDKPVAAAPAPEETPEKAARRATKYAGAIHALDLIDALNKNK